MKRFGFIIILTTLSILGNSQSVGINTTGAMADPSAMVDIISTSKGMLIPRMDSIQRTTIVNPAIGLLVYDTDSNQFWYYDGGQWSGIKTDNKLTDADLDTKIVVEQSPDDDKIRFISEGYEIAYLDDRTFHLGASDGSMFIGKNAGKSDNGNSNGIIAIGKNALRNNVSGNSNIGIGAYTLYNTTDKGDNTAIGDSSLIFNSLGATKIVHGSNNSAIGSKALVNNTIGSHNTAVGSHSLYSNDEGGANTSIGSYSLAANTSGDGNVSIGSDNLKSNTIGSNNSAVGDQALEDNINGDNNIAMGRYALQKNISGLGNVAIGYNAHQKSDDGDFNISLGEYALYKNASGHRNIAIGRTALYNNLGSQNTALGYEAMYKNTLGMGSIALGSQALHENTTIDHLVAIGDSALYNNGIGASGTDGTENIAVGSKALQFNNVGKLNTAVGYQSLRANENGNNNTALGPQSLENNNSGSSNTAIGANVLENNLSGSQNTAIGDEAMSKNTLGEGSVALGFQALHENTTIDHLVAIGDSALYYNGIGASGTDGTQNVAIGSKALLSNDVGKLNTAVGYQSLRANEYGNNNTALGAQSLETNNSGTSNTGIGANVLENNLSGSQNTSVGYASLSKNTSGTGNTALGYLASQDNLDGLRNVAIGYSADANNVSGDNNTIIGYSAGRYNQAHSKSGSVFIGYEAGYNETTDNKLYIDNSNTSSPLVYGDFDADLFRINGDLNVNGSYTFPGSDGTNNQVLTTDGSGNASWSDRDEVLWSEGLNSNIFYQGGNIGIGLIGPTSLLHLSTTTSMTEVVDFTGGVMASGADLLNLTVDAASANDAQIIEANRGGTNVFKVNGNGQTSVGSITISDDYMLTVGKGSNGSGVRVVGNSKFEQTTGTENILDIMPGNTTSSIGKSGVRMSGDKNGLSSYSVVNDSSSFKINFEALNNVYERLKITDAGIFEFGQGAFVMNPSVGGNSRFITDEIEIRGGSDLAEHFDVARTNIETKPGMIVSIDPENAGKLTISSKAYDKKVAGIVSGANGIKTGLFMGQDGSIADGHYPIALTGRVYVYANNEGGLIQPGDLLTTSSSPGVAMKANDYTKAQGAIVGKAMTPIDDEGFVLVLVNLQ